MKKKIYEILNMGSEWKLAQVDIERGILLPLQNKNQE